MLVNDALSGDTASDIWRATLGHWPQKPQITRCIKARRIRLTLYPLRPLSNPQVSSRRLCTEAMLKVLQSEIRKGKRRSVELSFVGDHLVITEEIGHGGFGRVFRGSWHKRPAAIKVRSA